MISEQSFISQHQLMEQAVERFGLVEFVKLWFVHSVSRIENEAELATAKSMATKFTFDQRWVDELQIVPKQEMAEASFLDNNTPENKPKTKDDLVGKEVSSEEEIDLAVESITSSVHPIDDESPLNNEELQKDSSFSLGLRFVGFSTLIAVVIGIARWLF